MHAAGLRARLREAMPARSMRSKPLNLEASVATLTAAARPRQGPARPRLHPVTDAIVSWRR
eukprot:6196534-Pleurochrysis_carterae.AAC.6